MEDLEDEEMEVDEFDRSLAMFHLMNLDEVFNKVVDMDWDFDEDTMYDVVNEYMFEMRWDHGPVVYDDVMPHQKMLFVPKKPSAVARLHEYSMRREPREPPVDMVTISVTIAV